MVRLFVAVALGLLLAASASMAAADPLDLLGIFDQGTAGYNATVVGLDGVAYLGSWGGPAECPSFGARVIDVHDPAAPVLIGSAAVYQGTTAEHLAAVHYASKAFTGNVLFAGIQRCQAGGAAASGLAIWD